MANLTTQTRPNNTSQALAVCGSHIRQCTQFSGLSHLVTETLLHSSHYTTIYAIKYSCVSTKLISNYLFLLMFQIYT